VLFQFDQHQAKYSLNDYLWKRCSIEAAAYDVTARALGTDETDCGRSRVYLIPSSLNTGEIARILREGYDVAQLNDGIQALLDQLQLDFLFIDTHPGVNEETLLSIAISDVLVLMMRPDNQDFQGTAVTVELARRLDVPEMFFVLNKVPVGTDVEALRQQVERTFRSTVAAMLPLNAEVARLGSGGIFSNQYPDHPYSQQLRQVVRRLLPGAVQKEV
jgi:MinD-like ATPase involved in chromosome partitioning or flagellar assembly